MALESIVNAAKSAVLGVVSLQSSDPISDRSAVLQDLHLAEKAWATDGVRSGTWFVRDGEHVAFTPTTRNGATLTIGGQTTNFIPADRFADYLVNMRSAIEAGEFDREIAGALHGSANVGGTAEVAIPAAREGSPDDVRQAQQDAALAREGRNPDGSLATVVRDGS
ncbi:hypothetical protein [Sphingomonas faeni]|uniref:hypothetical protein n=1 Tax=Sphingomonas faeni TaxID=185950 RepID=UPI0020C77E82|nr:hypothetical protein [Sphingomonas faeni]MCP8893042.1 hypothetical protein [Sphingomonas faeni]